MVLRTSNPVVVAPPGSKINIEANFNAQRALPQDDFLILFLVDARGIEATPTENDLNNTLTVLPTSRMDWTDYVTLFDDGPKAFPRRVFDNGGSLQAYWSRTIDPRPRRDSGSALPL